MKRNGISEFSNSSLLVICSKLFVSNTKQISNFEISIFVEKSKSTSQGVSVICFKKLVVGLDKSEK